MSYLVCSVARQGEYSTRPKVAMPEKTESAWRANERRPQGLVWVCLTDLLSTVSGQCVVPQALVRTAHRFLVLMALMSTGNGRKSDNSSDKQHDSSVLQGTRNKLSNWKRKTPAKKRFKQKKPVPHRRSVYRKAPSPLQKSCPATRALFPLPTSYTAPGNGIRSYIPSLTCSWGQIGKQRQVTCSWSGILHDDDKCQVPAEISRAELQLLLVNAECQWWCHR